MLAMSTSLRAFAVVAAIGGLAFLAGCGKPSNSWQAPGGPAAAAAAATPVSISAPADGATNVSTASEVVFSVADGTPAEVTLTDAAGAAIPGAMRPDGSAWVPATQLKYATMYTATVTAN